LLRLRRCFFWVLFCFLGLNLPIAQAKDFTVGIEDIDYYPHYDFTGAVPRGYFFELMQLFSKKSGHHFKFQKLPVKRLYLAAKDEVDLVYPDNPRWQQYLYASYPKTFSDPVIHTLGSTMVRPENRGLPVAKVKNLAVIHGFTPTRWLELKKIYSFNVFDVQDVPAALGLLLKSRVDAAVVEYNVAQAYLTTQQKSGELVFGEQLPFTEVPFLLSTVDHSELIDEFNQFLQSEQVAIQALKQQFNLIEHKAELAVISIPRATPE
jgi:polar amino acid transport system substrate-binding protein